MEKRKRPPTRHRGPFQVRLDDSVRRHMGSVASLSCWRKYRLDSVTGLLFVGLSFVVSFLVAQMHFPYSLPGVLLLCAVVILALLWGVGPAVFAVLLSLFALDYLAVPPFGVLAVPGWRSALQLLIFALAGIGVAALASRYEVAMWHHLAWERERALHETNLHVAASVATVSHELKTSLTVIKGNLKLCEQKVQRSVEPEAPYMVTARELISLLALLGQAKQQVMLEDRLVNDLVDISRMQTDRLELLKIRCDLATIARETVEEERKVSCARTMLLLLPSEQAVPVYADPARIRQVVTNYLTSTRTYSAACSIEVRLEVEEKLARVSVSDAGPGILALKQGLLWEALYCMQGSEVSSGEVVGLGVELYLCRTIIERHHGQVGVQSVPGKGSTFWFTLPLAGQDTPADPVR